MILALGTLLVTASCNKKDKDPCEDVTCLNSGTCADGTCKCEDDYYGTQCEILCVHGKYTSSCECNDGYEEADCNTESREKFLGTFSVEEKCITSSGTYNYTSVISAGSGDVRTIEISNFRDDPTYQPIVATVSDGTQLTIDPQYPKGGGQQVSGTGYINDSRDTIFIDYEFKASAGSNKEICTLVFY